MRANRAGGTSWDCGQPTLQTLQEPLAAHERVRERAYRAVSDRHCHTVIYCWLWLCSAERFGTLTWTPCGKGVSRKAKDPQWTLRPEEDQVRGWWRKLSLYISWLTASVRFKQTRLDVNCNIFTHHIIRRCGFLKLKPGDHGADTPRWGRKELSCCVRPRGVS